MSIGFDYGTANCSVAQMVDGRASRIPLMHGVYDLPSSLSAPTSHAVSEALFRHYDIKPSSSVGETALRIAIRHNSEEGLDIQADDIRFGHDALSQYLADPQDTFYVKPPKSFLGVSGLKEQQIAFFEDLVCAMMVNIKACAELSINKEIQDTVIGRPINFLGRDGDESNRQAQAILHRAAERAGFRHVEFQYEPVAAGLEYEASLTQDKTVLVVDIGGGTTDCSLIKMGPSWLGKQDRIDSLLAHSGRRIGGNDLDIFTAFKQFMPLFGLGTQNSLGLDYPVTQFWNPVAINDVQAQREFYQTKNRNQLLHMKKEALNPGKLARLLELYDCTLGHSIVRQAEQAKIALATQDTHSSQIALSKEYLDISLSAQELASAIAVPTAKIQALVQEAMTQGQIIPDVVFMTGGSAHSPILRNAISSVIPDVPIVNGDNFGSVAAGLARWSKIVFS